MNKAQRKIFPVGKRHLPDIVSCYTKYQPPKTYKSQRARSDNLILSICCVVSLNSTFHAFNLISAKSPANTTLL